VDAGLAPLERLVAAMIRRGDLDAVIELAQWERGLKLEAHLVDARWREDQLVLTVEAKLVDAGGTTVALTDSGHGPVLTPPVPPELLTELGHDVLAVVDNSVRVSVVLIDPLGAFHFLPGTSEQMSSLELRTAAVARLHPEGVRDEDRLADDRFTVAARFRGFGWKLTEPVSRGSGGVRGSLPASKSMVLGHSQRRVSLAWKEGQLRVVVGAPPPARGQDTLQTQLYGVARGLPDPVARTLRDLRHRLRSLRGGRDVPVRTPRRRG
jgi:hypothetical protein